LPVGAASSGEDNTGDGSDEHAAVRQATKAAHEKTNENVRDIRDLLCKCGGNAKFLKNVGATVNSVKQP
jgi:hypothetical protein